MTKITKNTISCNSYSNPSVNIHHCSDYLVEQTKSYKTNYYVFCFVCEGLGELDLPNGHCQIHSGTFFVLFPNQTYNLHNTSAIPLNITEIGFSGYMIDQCLNSANLDTINCTLEDTNDDYLRELFTNISRSANLTFNRYCRMASNLFALLDFLSKQKIEKEKGALLEVKPTKDEFLQTAITYINKSIKDKITVEEVAEHVGITRKYLHKLFISMTNESPSHYIKRKKIEEALHLLQECGPQASIKYVSDEMGYCNPYYFSKEFKKFYGLSPKKYIKQYIEKESH